MATWLDLALDNRAAAQELSGKGHYRSSVSRSYYAAYSAVVHLLSGKRVTYAYGRANPPHEAVAGYMVHSLTRPGRRTRERLAKTFRRLMKARVDADYRPGLSCDLTMAKDALRACYEIFTVTGVLP